MKLAPLREAKKKPEPLKSLSEMASARCTMEFGFNATDRKVALRLSVLTQMLVLTPEEAEDVAVKLVRYAAAARGENV